MLTYSDYGIILEMIGFFLFLVSAKKMPITGYRLLEGEPEDKVSQHWRCLYWELTGNKSQALRVSSIILILIGLSFQMSLFITDDIQNITSVGSEVASLECSKDVGLCYESKLIRVIDGDTIKDSDNQSIRFSLSAAPELQEPGGIQSKEFIESVCPIGSDIIIDEDDKQLKC